MLQWWADYLDANQERVSPFDFETVSKIKIIVK